MSIEKLRSAGIIPARGGSKGVPRKNIQLLAGKPLIAWTIEAALASTIIERVIVSTEDAEIAGVAQQFGAEVIWRPDEIATDTASSESALLHVLEELQTKEKYEPDLVVFLQCTSPLTLPEDIDQTVSTLLHENADSALTVTEFHGFLWQQGTKGAVALNHDMKTRPLRQEREAQFLETGSVYVMRTEGFRRARHRFFGKVALHVMPLERCWEIDDAIDFRIAEVLLREVTGSREVSQKTVWNKRHEDCHSGR
jgi:CMP-N-acetylneuraminic acid synthetase